MNRLFSPDQVVGAYIKSTSVENNAEPNYNLSETRNVTSTIPGGTVNVAEISITVRSGERITLAGQYSNLLINEDIFASCISGSITIIDTAGFLESFRIKGGEQINIKITKPYTNDIIIWREDLIVHKISESAVDPTTFNSSFDLSFVFLSQCCPRIAFGSALWKSSFTLRLRFVRRRYDLSMPQQLGIRLSFVFLR